MSPAEAEVQALADQIASALRAPATSTAVGKDCPCQAQIVELAARTGWGTARRLVLDRVRRGEPVEGVG